MLPAGANTNAIAFFVPPTRGSMMALMRRPPVRCQALADSILASRGLATMTQRGIAATRQCGDIPTETLFLDDDFVVINKVSSSAWALLPTPTISASPHSTLVV